MVIEETVVWNFLFKTVLKGAVIIIDIIIILLSLLLWIQYL